MTVHMTLIGENIKPLMEAMKCIEYKACNSIIIYRNDFYKLDYHSCAIKEYHMAFREEANTVELTDEEVNRFTSLWFISEDVETTFQSILHKLSKE